MAYEFIRVDESHGGQVSQIRLSAPPGNILSAKMIGEISDRLAEERAVAHRKLIVFSGEGKHFSFGASVEEHLPEKVGEMLPAFHRLMTTLVGSEVPTLARVTGMCLGGAFELALCCNFVHADETAQFAVPEIQLGVFPPVAAALVPLTGASTFLSEMILTGEKFPARRLYEAGLINRVVPAGSLDAEVSAFIEKHIVPKSASSLRMACRATRLTATPDFKRNLGALEKAYLIDLMNTKDAVEGIRAFVEKRPPSWTNA